MHAMRRCLYSFVRAELRSACGVCRAVLAYYREHVEQMCKKDPAFAAAQAARRRREAAWCQGRGKAGGETEEDSFDSGFCFEGKRSSQMH